jgi:hypothetical protein
MQPAQFYIDTVRAKGTELARYPSVEGERLVVSYRGRGGAQILDVPACGAGPAYRVDGGYHDEGVLRAFVEDYLEQAARFNRCPMGGEALAGMLDETEGEVVDELLAAIDWR